MTLFVYLIIVLAIFALLEALVLLVNDRAPKPVAAGPSLKRRTLADDGAPWLVGILLSSPITRFDTLVRTSGVKTTTSRVLTCMAVLTTATLALASFFLPHLALCAGLGVLVGVGLPLMVLSSIRKRRFNKIADQLPDALEMLVRSLRAGHPIPLGIKMIANEVAEPLGGEFRIVSDSMAYGLDLREALEKLTERVPVTELHYIVSAIRIQYETGGNLAEILSSLAAIMRERKKLRMKVKALSAESKWSGNIMSVLPFCVVGVMNWLNPIFYKDFGTKPVLTYVLVAAAAAVVFGIVMIRKIINIRV